MYEVMTAEEGRILTIPLISYCLQYKCSVGQPMDDLTF